MDILILGAGLAGLGAAITLAKSNVSLLVLEGQSVPGGRVNTVEMKPYGKGDSHGSALVEAGAQWLHGRHNELYAYCEKHNLLTDILSEEGLGDYMREDGIKFDEFLVKHIDFVVGEILEKCEDFARTSAEGAPASVERFLRTEFNKFLTTLKDNEDKRKASQLLDWHIRFQVIDNSCLSLDDLSSKCWGDYCFNGEDGQAHINFKESGFKQAVKRMIEDIGSDRVLFHKEILDVDFADGKMQVRCADGSIYMANHIIVTFSLGVLKNWNFFSGNLKLPKRYLQTIEDLGFEAIDKIFLQFDHPWWADFGDGIQLIWNDDHDKIDGWIRYLTGFDVLKPGPPNTLLAWVGGRGCHEMEKISDLDIVDDCIAILEKFTGRTIPKPIKYQCSRWQSNTFVRGAYAYPSTKLDKNGTTKEYLLRPIKLCDFNLKSDDSQILSDCPIVLFAGEAYHPKYFSTAHGAFQTGIEQANKILEYLKEYKLKKSKL